MCGSIHTTQAHRRTIFELSHQRIQVDLNDYKLFPVSSRLNSTGLYPPKHRFIVFYDVSLVVRPIQGAAVGAGANSFGRNYVQLEKLGEGTYATVYKVGCGLSFRAPSVLNLVYFVLTLCLNTGPIKNDFRNRGAQGDPPGCGRGDAKYCYPRDQSYEGYDFYSLHWDVRDGRVG